MKNLLTSTFFTICTLTMIHAQANYVDVLGGAKTVQLSPIFADLNLSMGSAKAAIPVSLPEGATGCYYTIVVLPKNKKDLPAIPLWDQLKQLKNQTDAADLSHLLQVPQTGRKTNVYLLKGKKNANGLENFQYFTYQEKYIGFKSFAGYLAADELTEFYIGLENTYELKGVKVKIEVVAVVDERQASL